MNNDKIPTKRTNQQSKALHKYLEMVSHELQNQGQSMRDVVRKMPLIEIPPTKNALKEIVWKPIMEVTLGRKSTTELKTNEVTQVYEIMAKFLAEQFQIDIPFPSEENTDEYIKSLDN